MKKTIFPTLLVIILGITIGLISQGPISSVLPGHTTAPSSTPAKITRTPPVTVSYPQTLQIDKINVSGKVESVGLDKNNKMDVPKSADDVGWYNLGPKPGEKGSAVIDGHLDRVTGAPAVFYDLTKLSPGDKIKVTDQSGNTYNFVVIRITKYPYDQFPLQEVFAAPEDKARLNLITCEGVFDQQAKNYSNRIVVYSELQT